MKHSPQTLKACCPNGQMSKGKAARLALKAVADATALPALEVAAPEAEAQAPVA